MNHESVPWGCRNLAELGGWARRVFEWAHVHVRVREFLYSLYEDFMLGCGMECKCSQS